MDAETLGSALPSSSPRRYRSVAVQTPRGVAILDAEARGGCERLRLPVLPSWMPGRCCSVAVQDGEKRCHPGAPGRWIGFQRCRSGRRGAVLSVAVTDAEAPSAALQIRSVAILDAETLLQRSALLSRMPRR